MLYEGGRRWRSSQVRLMKMMFTKDYTTINSRRKCMCIFICMSICYTKGGKDGDHHRYVSVRFYYTISGTFSVLILKECWGILWATVILTGIECIYYLNIYVLLKDINQTYDDDVYLRLQHGKGFHNLVYISYVKHINPAKRYNEHNNSMHFAIT
jgi:hypothetical protein